MHRRKDRAAHRDNDVDLEPHELVRDLCVALAKYLRPAVLYSYSTTLDPTEFVQPLYKGSNPLAISRRRSRAEESDGR